MKRALNTVLRVTGAAAPTIFNFAHTDSTSEADKTKQPKISTHTQNTFSETPPFGQSNREAVLAGKKVIKTNMPNPSNPRQAAIALLNDADFSPESYFAGWERDTSVSGISTATLDENGNSKLFQRSKLDCFNNDSPDINSDTLFNVASMTKMMTAATLLRMMESEELEEYFPDKLKTKLSHFHDLIESRYPEMNYVNTRLRSENKEITLEHLLTHTSGIPAFNPKLVTPEELRKLRSEEGMADGKFLDPVTSRQAPGNHAYSDIGYELLGLVISAVATDQSKKNGGSIVSCQEMMRKMVVDRLQMANTFTPDQISLNDGKVVVTDFPDKKIARGFDDNCVETNNFLRCISCAAVYSTPSEMCKFIKALFSDQTFENGGLFKKAETIALHNSVRVEQIEKDGTHFSNELGSYYYGIGFRFIETLDGKKIKFHTGGTTGFPGWAGYNDGKTVCCVMNSQGLTPHFANPILEMEQKRLKAQGKDLTTEEEPLLFCKINEWLVKIYNKEKLLEDLKEMRSATSNKEVLLREYHDAYCRNLSPTSSISDQEAKSFTSISLQRGGK